MIIPIYFFLFIELVMVSINDIRYRKIKNIWSLLNIIVAVILFISLPSLYPFSIESFQFTFAFILIGFLLFLLKIMGGGDSKFLASFFLLVPLNEQEKFFFYLLLGTIIIGVFFLLKNTIHNREEIMISMRNKDVQGVKNCFGTKFAYAPVILMTWIYFGYDIYLN